MKPITVENPLVLTPGKKVTNTQLIALYQTIRELINRKICPNRKIYPSFFICSRIKLLIKEKDGPSYYDRSSEEDQELLDKYFSRSLIKELKKIKPKWDKRSSIWDQNDRLSRIKFLKQQINKLKKK